MAETTHKSLLASLLAVQRDTPAVQKTKINPAFRSKYVSLDSLMETVMPVLNTHGLVWVTLPGRDPQGEPALSYRLIHAETGEAIEGTMPLMLAKGDPQGQGSAITYARRYSLMAVLGLVADEDDDGNKASRRTPAPAAKSNGHTATAAPVEQTTRPASAKQRSLIFARADERKLSNELLANAVLRATDNEPREWDSPEAAGDWLKRSLDRLPASRVDAVLEQIAGVPA
jgi:hypothetical protein